MTKIIFNGKIASISYDSTTIMGKESHKPTADETPKEMQSGTGYSKKNVVRMLQRLAQDDEDRAAELCRHLNRRVRPEIAELLSLPDVTSPEKRRLTPDQTEKLIHTLKSHLAMLANGSLRQALLSVDVEKSLRADPEAQFSVMKLKVTGGEPQIVGVDGDELVIEDRSAESPLGRRGLNLYEADIQRECFGKRVKFQSPDSYMAMQTTGNFDTDSFSLLETDPSLRENGAAMVGDRDGNSVRVIEELAERRSSRMGWRAAVRVKIAK